MTIPFFGIFLRLYLAVKLADYNRAIWSVYHFCFCSAARGLINHILYETEKMSGRKFSSSWCSVEMISLRSLVDFLMMLVWSQYSANGRKINWFPSSKCLKCCKWALSDARNGGVILQSFHLFRRHIVAHG